MIKHRMNIINNYQKTWRIIPSIFTLALILLLSLSCKGDDTSKSQLQEKTTDNNPTTTKIIIGGDFSILKKMQDKGGIYKDNKGVEKDPLEIFYKNGYTYARLRIFHTPNMVGPVCNSLEYTIALAKQIKKAGMKLLLNFHYSDRWADPKNQKKPNAWRGLSLEKLKDSLSQYSKNVIVKMKEAEVTPDMVQIGNEITTGMIWPEGKIYNNNYENWRDFTELLKAAISGVKEGYGNNSIPIMIHIDRGGDKVGTKYFFDNIDKYKLPYDVIGLSYYPWWHGKLSDLEETLSWLSKSKSEDIMIVETAYYANGYYPPLEGAKAFQPFPPTEQGQYDFLKRIATLTKKYPKVKAIFYWKPDGLEISNSGVRYLGRSLFDENGNAYKGIEALKAVLTTSQ